MPVDQFNHTAHGPRPLYHQRRAANAAQQSEDHVNHGEVIPAMTEYDRMEPQQFVSQHGFAAITTFELVWKYPSLPPKAILGRFRLRDGRTPRIR